MDTVYKQILKISTPKKKGPFGTPDAAIRYIVPDFFLNPEYSKFLFHYLPR